LSKKGRELAAAIDAIAEWAHKWIKPGPPAAAAKPPRARRRA
jgi:DNA-binding HxlR family transcriptional regulator